MQLRDHNQSNCALESVEESLRQSLRHHLDVSKADRRHRHRPKTSFQRKNERIVSGIEEAEFAEETLKDDIRSEIHGETREKRDEDQMTLVLWTLLNSFD